MENIKIERIAYGMFGCDGDDEFYITVMPVLEYVCREYSLDLTYPKNLEELNWNYFVSIFDGVDSKEKKKILEIFKQSLQEDCIQRCSNPYIDCVSEPVIKVFDVGICKFDYTETATDLELMSIYSAATNGKYKIPITMEERLDFCQKNEVGVRIMVENCVNFMKDFDFIFPRVKKKWDLKKLNQQQKDAEIKRLVKGHKLYNNHY